MRAHIRDWLIVFGCFFAALTVSASEASAQAPDKEFTIAVGETLTFNARGINRVTIGLSQIADAKSTGDGRQVILTGKSPGVTTVNIFSDRGQKTLLIRVVGVNPESLAAEVREVLGERSGVDVRVVKGRVLLEGEVASENFKRKIEKLVELYPNQVLNFTQFREAFVEGARMVALDVYFVQLAVTDRDRIGIHWGQFLGGNFSYGMGDVPLYYNGDDEQVGAGVLPGETNPQRLPRPITLTGGEGASYWSVIGNLNVALDLMETHGLIKTIQHGIIVTETGTEAEYHVGGTVYVKISSLGAATLAEIPYGMRMKVKPILDFENRVKINIEGSMSELDFANGVEGMPALRNNDISATVNMMEGQSVLVTSARNTNDTSTESGWWLISRIPILGWLFKSRAFLGTSVNNALFITPRLYEPGGKTHRTLIQGVFESLLDDGADADDLPELSNASAPARPATPAAPATEESAADDEGDEE